MLHTQKYYKNATHKYYKYATHKNITHRQDRLQCAILHMHAKRLGLGLEGWGLGLDRATLIEVSQGH